MAGFFVVAGEGRTFSDPFARIPWFVQTPRIKAPMAKEAVGVVLALIVVGVVVVS